MSYFFLISDARCSDECLLLRYAVNSGGSVGVFAYNATLFTSPSFRDHSSKSTASLASSFFYSSGDPLDHSSSPTVDRKEKRNSRIPSSSHPSLTLNQHQHNNTHSTPLVPSSSLPSATGASRVPPSLSLDTRHLARSSNAPEEQPGSTESSETLRQSKSLDANPRSAEFVGDGDEDDDDDGDDDDGGDGDGDGDGDDKSPTVATPARSAQREQDQQLPVSVTFAHPSVAHPSAALVHDGPPRGPRFEPLEVVDSISGRQSDSRLGAPWRRSKGKATIRRSRPYSATAGRPMLLRRGRGMRQRAQRVK